MTYRLLADNSLDISYSATTDKKTPVNLTNHSYFNLNGDPSRDILNNTIYINADSITPVDSTFMTTGEITAVHGTAMDFTTRHAIGDGYGDSITDQQVIYGGGYDHNWVLNTGGDMEKLAVEMYSPETGITLSVYTDRARASNSMPATSLTARSKAKGASHTCATAVWHSRHSIIPTAPTSPNGRRHGLSRDRPTRAIVSTSLAWKSNNLNISKLCSYLTGL